MTLKLRIKKEPHELLYVTISCMVLMSAICDGLLLTKQSILTQRKNLPKIKMRKIVFG